MTKTRLTPLGAVGRGLLAAAIDTLAMDLLWYWRYKQGGGESSFVVWEFSVGLDDWDKASAPGKIGRRLYEGFRQQALGARYAALTTNLMHWSYGAGWGALFGIVVGSANQSRARFGLVFGPLVFGTSYVLMPLAQLYKPLWEYDATTLWKDFSAHLLYAVVTAAAFRWLSKP